MDNFSKDLAREIKRSDELSRELNRIIWAELANAQKTASNSHRKLNDAEVQKHLNTLGTDVTPVGSDSRTTSAPPRSESEAHREIDIRNEAKEQATDFGKQVADSQRQNQGHTSHDKLMESFTKALTAQANEKPGDAPKQNASDQELATYFGHKLASFAKENHITDTTTFNRGVEDAFQAGLDKNSSKG